ncbi:MAG: hypothetical protein ABW189_07430 [Rickettsiales bacterium]
MPADNTSKVRNNPKVLAALTDNKVLNKDVRLEDIVRVSGQISEMIGDADLAAWTFISPNYIYTGDDAVDVTKGRLSIDPKAGR